MPGVSNSSPLIYLESAGDLDLLPRLFGQISIPDAVYREVVIGGGGKPGADAVARAIDHWLAIGTVKNRDRVAALMELVGLDIGEAEAIVLAQELGQRIVFLDDRSAVNVARSFGLEVVRTPALYVTAKNRGLIESVRPKIDALRAGGFWLKDTDYLAVLAGAGELPSPTDDYKA